MARLVLALVLLALLGLFVLAVWYLPWWACPVAALVALALPVVLGLAARWRIRSFLRQAEADAPPGMPGPFAALFKLKGSPLRGARAEVHAVDRVPAPESAAAPADGAAAADGPREYYRVDVTIRPTRWGVGFKRWQPGELGLMTPGRGWLDHDDTCRVVDVAVRGADGFEPEDDMRYAGAHRLRLVLAVRPGTRRLAFQYYTEQFGELVLPAPLLPPAGPEA